MVAHNDLILALDERGLLLLLRANPKEIELLDERGVSDDEAWHTLLLAEKT